MIAKFITEGFAARKNTDMDRKLASSIKNRISAVLLQSERFSFDLPDEKPGNWFFLPGDGEIAGYLVFSYSIYDTVWKETEVAVSVYIIEKDFDSSMQDSIAFSAVDMRNKTEAEIEKINKTRSEAARNIVKKASVASSIEDIVKVFTLERKKRTIQGE